MLNMTCKHCTHFLPVVILFISPEHLAKNEQKQLCRGFRFHGTQDPPYAYCPKCKSTLVQDVCTLFHPASLHVVNILCCQTRLSFCFAAWCSELRMSTSIIIVYSGGSVAASTTSGCV